MKNEKEIEKVRAYSVLVKKYAEVFFDMDTHHMDEYESEVMGLLAEAAKVNKGYSISKKDVDEIWNKCSHQADNTDVRRMTEIGFLQAVQKLGMRVTE